MTTIHSLLDELRQAASSSRDMGDKFERLIAAYLVTDPLYRDKYSDVWLWSEWPGRDNQPDTGIDLVAKERYTGDYCAIQCKFYSPTHTLQKSDIDSFFTASGRHPFTSRIIVSTTDKWSTRAEAALQGQQIPVSRVRVQDLADSPVDWSQFSLSRPQDIKLKAKKQLRQHQKVAVQKVLAGFRDADRGKLIMACGTGKTFTALKIAERMAANHGHVLFLVPSISLLSQSLREWTAEAEVSLHSLAVCSDTKVGKKSDSEDITTHDLAFPATTDARTLLKQYDAYSGKRQMTVVFSTYQSIEAVADAQAKGLPEFDLVICDEAHRTTGVTLADEDESNFVKVHDQGYLRAKKRLYMTATPRIYDDSSKAQAEDNDATLCSMDDESIYGKEFHRLGFSEAVGSGLLADYKVMVLAVDEKFVSRAFQSQIADENSEINLNDVVKITGCWNGLSKRMVRAVDDQPIDDDTSPMRRAVAFSRSIKDSKRIADLFAEVVNRYRQNHQDDEDLLCCEVEHVDGTFNALQRNEKLDWLKADTSGQGNVCRILSNARCLSEGVDVPALDAVMFLNPRNSVVDVVQSVGRVMRRAEGKKYGYVILPIGIPADIAPEEALKNNEKYKVVWQVLQALRAHDDRFNATVNHIELNKSRPDQIQVIGVSGSAGDEGDGDSQLPGGEGAPRPVQFSFNLPYIEEWRDAIYARIVLKCGDRRYWETWAKDVADIADRHITRIKALLESSEPEHRLAFDEFLKGLQTNINPSIDEADAIEMLSQHLITKPVFDALFEGYEFTQHNPVSLSMQKMLDVMERQSLEKETGSLEKFYVSVKERASGIDNAEGKQRIVVELYDKFFRTAFPRMAERLGIVYTPVEVVDFMIRSIDEILHDEFGVGLTDAGVHLLDPFTGTATFIVRTLQSGLIKPEDLLRKYKHELHANEIVLLAYYIAAINIEQTFHYLAGGDYTPFDGIVLTDTFQMKEHDGSFSEIVFPENNQRAARQNHTSIKVIFSNPPYSVGQESQNDLNQNMDYPRLDARISQTYATNSAAELKRNLYASEIRAIRWASDRIGQSGIVCYVSNGSYIDGNSFDGLRKSLTEEFSAIYCFNLRGNARTSGEVRRKEKGNVFGSGTRTTIAITLMVKNPTYTGRCRLHYHDIGDYLSREEKLAIIADFASVKSIPWSRITPNANHDWINQRNAVFETFMPVLAKDADDGRAVFDRYSPGIVTSRDPWAYNFSKEKLIDNVNSMISFYNLQVSSFKALYSGKPKNEWPKVDGFIDTDPTKISWSANLKDDLARLRFKAVDHSHVTQGMYRPFCKQWVYYDRQFIERPGQMSSIFVTGQPDELAIYVSGPAASKGFSALLTQSIPNFHFLDTGQCLPLHYCELQDAVGGLFDEAKPPTPTRSTNVRDACLAEFTYHYGDGVSKEDIFYYLYGILHSREYKSRFEADLKKMLPRVPFAKDFWAFSRAGRELAYWHLNYETIEPYPLQEFTSRMVLNPKEDYRVQKMTWARSGKVIDKSTIIYNSNIRLCEIPLEAYEYVVNGKSAIEWIMERYQLTKDNDSQIVNDPNDWSDDPMYIINLVKRIVRVSLETVKIVNGLPGLEELQTA